MIRAALALLVWLACVLSPAFAQDGPDYDAWDVEAQRIEAALEDGRASTAAFEDLRSNLVSWRGRFLAAQDANAARIETLESQIAALGAEPEEGETEPEEIANRRQELNEQLNDLQAPRLKAEEAHSRATGLIEEIDKLIASRATERLLKLGPTPLNPALWLPAGADLVATVQGVVREFSLAYASDGQVPYLTDNAPALLFLVALSLVLFARGPRILDRLLRVSSETPAKLRLMTVARAVLGLLVFAAATFALIGAIRLSGFAGARGQVFLDAVLLAAIASRVGTILAPLLVAEIGMDRASRPEATIGAALGIVWAASWLVGKWAEMDAYGSQTIAVLQFPLILLTSWLLFRLTGIVRTALRNEVGDSSTELSLRQGAKSALAWLAMFVSVASPLGAAIGYGAAATAMLYPTIPSFGLLGLLVGISATLRDSYGVITSKSEEDSSQALLPVMLSGLAVLASLPVFALIWGMRPAQLAEFWARMQEGVRLGETRISAADFVVFLLVFVFGYLLTRLIQKALRSTVLPRTRLDIGGQNAVVSGIGYTGIVLAALAAISSAGLDLSSLAIVAGALSVGIGFGMQNIVSNFVSGIILLIERPIAEGDWIEVGGAQGYVRDISVRSTRIETFDRSDVIVPNADFVTGTVTNFTRGNLIGRVIVPVSVAYGTDTKKVEAILKEIAEEHPMVAVEPPPAIYFLNFGADGLDFEIRAILRDVNWVMSVKSDLNHEIAKRLTEEGIEIPFPQRDLWLRNPEAIAGASSKGET